MSSSSNVAPIWSGITVCAKYFALPDHKHNATGTEWAMTKTQALPTCLVCIAYDAR